MLLITPFNAVTKLPIEVCAPEVSGLMVNVVGVSGAEAAVKLRVTPLMALLTTLLALPAGNPLIEKLASSGAGPVRFNDDSPPLPPEGVTVRVLAAPVLVPVSTRREPSVVVMMLAVTPGLLVAELMAEAMPARVSLPEPMVIVVEALPTAMVNVPVPIAAVLDSGAEVNVAAVARWLTCREYWPATASDVVVAEAMLLSATVASNPANWLGFSMAWTACCSVSRALVNVP
jgi:hypothetical protein